MTPDGRATLRHALLLTAVTGWCVWMVMPVSPQAGLVLLIAWFFAICWLVGGVED